MAADMALFAVSGASGTAGTMLIAGFLPNEWPYAGILALILCVLSGVTLGIVLDLLEEPVNA